MKFYFSASIRGGREYASFYEIITKELAEYGEVLTEFVSSQSLTSYGSLNMASGEIYDRDTSLIVTSDVVVADCSIPSLGVGYEIAYAENLGKKIYCLYHKGSEKKLSAMIAGNPHCIVETYESVDDIAEILKKWFA